MPQCYWPVTTSSEERDGNRAMILTNKAEGMDLEKNRISAPAARCQKSNASQASEPNTKALFTKAFLSTATTRKLDSLITALDGLSGS